MHHADRRSQTTQVRSNAYPPPSTNFHHEEPCPLEPCGRGLSAAILRERSLARSRMAERVRGDDASKLATSLKPRPHLRRYPKALTRLSVKGGTTMQTTWKPDTEHGDLTTRSTLPDSVYAFP